jgi:glycine/D-amino acid oxidase-like deaminating enzyme
VPFEVYRHKVQEIGYHRTLVSRVNETGDQRQFAVAFASEQRKSGNVLIGTCREFVGRDNTTNLDVVAAVAQRAIRLVPLLSQVSVLRVWTGLRPHTPDHLPIIGPVDEVPGFYVASGHEGLGTTLAPITAELVTRYVTGGPIPLPVASLLPGRFRHSVRRSSYPGIAGHSTVPEGVQLGIGTSNLPAGLKDA